MSQRDTFIGWLNDAHSMEKALLPTLENHANDAANMPEIQQGFLRHLEETRRHVDMVHQCIVSMGDEPSTVKNLIGSVTGAVQSVATAPFADEPVKNFLSDYAAENFEVASYTSLIAAAHALGETQIATTCEQILREDQAFAQWLQQHIPTVTNAFLAREVAATA